MASHYLLTYPLHPHYCITSTYAALDAATPAVDYSTTEVGWVFLEHSRLNSRVRTSRLSLCYILLRCYHSFDDPEAFIGWFRTQYSSNDYRQRLWHGVVALSLLFGCQSSEADALLQNPLCLNWTALCEPFINYYKACPHHWSPFFKQLLAAAYTHWERTGTPLPRAHTMLISREVRQRLNPPPVPVPASMRLEGTGRVAKREAVHAAPPLQLPPPCPCPLVRGSDTVTIALHLLRSAGPGLPNQQCVAEIVRLVQEVGTNPELIAAALEATRERKRRRLSISDSPPPETSA